ncbi:hypothetical protein N9A80_02160 [Rhodopirellula sp.]|nr:hypothetical protein [Rhodopirellula sp.]
MIALWIPSLVRSSDTFVTVSPWFLGLFGVVIKSIPEPGWLSNERNNQDVIPKRRGIMTTMAIHRQEIVLSMEADDLKIISQWLGSKQQ